jgi:ribosomal protein S18 acetylase RimI-like enzyme
MAAQPDPRTIHLEELLDNAPAELRERACELLLEYGRFVIAQPGAARFCYGALEKEAAQLPFSYQEQGGGCMVARVNDTPAAFVAWRPLAASAQVVPDAWELKRLWVRPAGRGLGLGRALTQAVLDRAAHAQRKAVYLDTAPSSMATAYRLYLEMGFVSCAPYNSNPVEGLVYLVKFL